MSKGSGAGLPLVAFRLNPEDNHHYDEFAIAHQLRERGWVVPAYTMAPHSEKLKLMRVVVREDFSRSRCDALIKDIGIVLETLKEVDAQWVKDHEHHKKKQALPTRCRIKRSTTTTRRASTLCRASMVRLMLFAEYPFGEQWRVIVDI